MAEPNYIVLKILFAGNFNAGKTSLIQRETLDIFSDNFSSTIGIDFKIKMYQVNGLNIKAQIWDGKCYGGQKFSRASSIFFKNSHAVGICFDLNDKLSFHGVEGWIQQAKASNSGRLFIVGCKGDLQEIVREEEIQKIKEKYNVEYIKTSSKQNWGVKEGLQTMLKAGLQEKLEREKEPLPNNPNGNDKKCQIM